MTRSYCPNAASPSAMPPGSTESPYDYGSNADRGGEVAGKPAATPYLDAAGGDDEVAIASRRPGAGPSTHAEALARHADNVERVEDVLDRGRAVPGNGEASGDTLLRNTAEWFDHGEAELFVLSPTHDSDRRKGVGDHQVAYFDARVPYRGAGADYDKSMAGIEVMGTGSYGKTEGRRVTLYDPKRKGPDEIAAILVHEVQHDADRTEDGERFAVEKPDKPSPDAVSVAPAHVYNHYQSEFRAHWMEHQEGTFGDPYGRSDGPSIPVSVAAVDQGPDRRTGGGDDVRREVMTGFENGRQQAIFLAMWTEQPGDLYWDWQLGASGGWTVAYGSFIHYYALDPNFKAMVDAFSEPSGGNLVNSVRIEALGDAIDTGTWPPVADAVRQLDTVDRAFLADRAASAALWERARAELAPDDVAKLEEKVPAR